MMHPDSIYKKHIETFSVNGKQRRYSSFMQFQKEPKRKGQAISSPAFPLNVYLAFQKI